MAGTVIQTDLSSLVRFPCGSVLVGDPEEEVFLLYTHLASVGVQDGTKRFTGLGSVNTLQDTIPVQFTLPSPKIREKTTEPTYTFDTQVPRRHHVKKMAMKHAEIKERTIDLMIQQDKTSLRSRKGDTGSVLWRVSMVLAQALLTDLCANSTPLIDPQILKCCDVLELGAGTGLLSIILSPWARHYTVTDLNYLVPLIRKNITSNLPVVQQAINIAPSTTPPKSKRHNNKNLLPPSSSDGTENITIESLDWVALKQEYSLSPSKAASMFRLDHANPPDLIICADCVYNPALITALLRTIDHYTYPGRTRVLIAVELRAEDVIRELLELWTGMKKWVIWRVGDGKQSLKQSDAESGGEGGDGGASWLGIGFAVWIGWKTNGEEEIA